MKYQVMRDLTPIEYEALKADIAQRGVLVPIEVDEDGEILDGHHRRRAWEELQADGVGLADYPVTVRRGLTEEQKRNHARSLNVLRRHLTKEERDDLMRQMRADGMTYQQIADAVGVGFATAYRATSDVEFIQMDKVTGADGKHYPATKTQRTEPEPLPKWAQNEQPRDLPDGKLVHGPIGDYWLGHYDSKKCAKCGQLWVGDLEYCPYCNISPEVRGLYVQKESAARPPHVTNNSGDNEWYTPQELIAAAYDVMGCIDVDPASSDEANKVVEAIQIYTAQNDGLWQPWWGNVWLNPPYASNLIGKFVQKLTYHVKAGDVTQAIVLVNNATDTAWFRELVSIAQGVVFTAGRVKFWKPDGELGAPLQGQAIVYVGDNESKFYRYFGPFGWCARVSSDGI